MIFTLVAAWRNLIKRIAVDWLILTAGAVTILLAMILLAAGPIYADAVTLSGLRSSLVEAPSTSTAVVVQARLPPSNYEQADRVVSDALGRRLEAVDPAVTRVVESESLELPDQPSDGPVLLTVARSMEGAEEHVSLVEGEWPTGAASPYPIAVSSATAEELGIRVGEELTTVDRRDRSRVVEMAVVGIYRLDEASDPYWLEDPLVLDGVVESGGFRTFGPLLTDEGAILGGLTQRATATWRAHLDFTSLEIAEAPGLRARLAGLEAALTEAPVPGVSEFRVTSDLTTLLADTDRSLTVTRSSTLALLIQLATLAGYALALTAGLLVDTRRTETSLLRARGASPSQLAAISLLEALLLVVPTALAAPWVAAVVLDAIGSYPPLASLGLEIDPVVTTESRAIVTLAAVAGLVALAWPAWRSARSQFATDARSLRQSARSGAQRAGVDIALVGLALLGFWQLQSLGPELAARVQGRFGVDPVLIAAPALGLLAGAVLALRIVPLLARVGERLARAGRLAVPALAAWQVARRPLRYARSALLLIMAVGIGFFAASYSTTWVQSQQDQAAHQVGADLRVEPNRRTGDSLSDLYLVAEHESVDGVARSMPVSRFPGALPGSELPAEFILLDSDAATEVVEIRPDLAPRFEALMEELRAARPDLSGIPVPGTPEMISLSVGVTEQQVEGFDGELIPPMFRGSLNLVLQDDKGLLHRVELGQIEVNQGVQRLEGELTTTLGGSAAEPAYPLEVVDIEIVTQPAPTPATALLDIVDLAVADGNLGWESIPIDHDPEAWVEETFSAGFLVSAPQIAEPAEQPEGALRLAVEPAVGPPGSRTVFGARPRRAAALPTRYPIVVTGSWLQSSARAIGDELRLPALGLDDNLARIEGSVDVFPTVEPGAREAVIADLATVQALGHHPGADLGDVDEYWLALSAEDGLVKSRLQDPPLDSVEVVERTERARNLATDPVALGTVGALAIGFLSAAIFAAVGFAVSATVSARERLTEFGLLRALGLSPRQLAAWMTVEQGLLVVSSLGFGTLVGWALTATILPLVTVTQEGTRAVPEVIVVYPWQTVLRLELGMIAVLGVIVVIMSLLLRRIGLGSLLRLGED